ncbi:MAG TPA: hypothetical protein VK203_07425 [Nostocaceae cyanobacterium]|nr:hypothetical protein [Nostocaceae cyanobacterium]
MTATITPFDLQNRFAKIQDLPEGFHAIPDTTNKGWNLIYKISPNSKYTTIKFSLTEKQAKRKAQQLNQVLSKK